ncbi:glycosyltransferase [Calditrichota bacterium]
MNKKNKICFILGHHPMITIGGTELQANLLINELLSRGWKVEIVSQNQIDKYNEFKNHINNSLKHYYYRKGFFSIDKFIKIFVCLLRTNSYYYYQRLGHVHTGATALYCMLFKKKMIYAIAANLFTEKDSRKKKHKYEASKFNLKYFIKLFDLHIVDQFISFGMKHSDLIITQTVFQKNKIKKNFGLDSFLLRNSYKFNDNEVQKKDNIILWVGNMHKIKQPEVFFRLIEETNYPGWTYIMIGRPHLYFELIKKNEKRERFKYLGELSFSDTIYWFKKSKILINTSFTEGFSNTFIQAWYYRSLLLSYSVDPDYLISKYKYGIYLDGKFENLKDKLSQAVNNYSQFVPLINRAYIFVKSEFDLKKNTSLFQQRISNL